MHMRQGRARARMADSRPMPQAPPPRNRRAFRWPRTAAALCFALGLAAAPAHAEPEPPTNEAVPAEAAAPEPPPSAATAVLPETPEPRAESHAPPQAAAAAPDNLADLPAWLDYKNRRHIAALPLEARVFHRRGVLLRESGNAAEAVRMVRGAAELDPGYLAPHLTLAEWSLLSEPSQALLRYATVLDLARRNFMLQLSLAANGLYALLQALFLGLLATALLILVTRQEQLRHGWSEALSRFVSRRSARLWSWALLVLPFTVGFGFTLPALGLLGWCWPQLRARERFVLVSLAVAAVSFPLLGGVLDRLTLPLDPSRPPLHGVALVESEPLTAERAAELSDLARREPGNPYLQFAAGWAARRTGRLDLAEAHYRKALALWPGDDRVLNNLGCTLLMLGRHDEALARFVEATAARPDNAAAWFNQAQVHTQRFDYRAATDALSRASALDFEMVKGTQAQATEDGTLPLVEGWIAPARLWNAVASARTDRSGRGALPPAWRQRLETRGWLFSAAALLALAGGLVAGLRLHAALPLRACSNCDRVVCRRCAERRRERALCPECVAAEARAESPDFARLLLVQRRRRLERLDDGVRAAQAALVPGLGLLHMRRVFSPLLLLTATMALLAPAFGELQAFAFEPRLAVAPAGLPWQLQATGWIVIYAWSVLGYFRVLARRKAQAAGLAAPVRSRVTQSTSRAPFSEAA